MSRRKQSNPKPLKCAGEESWNEAEDGDGNSEKKITEESASDCPSSPGVGAGESQQNLRIPAVYSEEQYRQDLQQTLIDMIPKNMEVYSRSRRRGDIREGQQGQPSSSKSRNSSNSRRSEKSIERISATDTHSLLWQQKTSSSNNHSNLSKLNHAKQQLALGFSSGRNESTRSRSSDAPDLTEVDISEAEDGDERRKPRSCSSRSRTPDIPSVELNGSPGPFSHQQILQAAAAGLPYFHLLPPALRNDAARYLFIPPVLPGADLPAVPSSTPNSGATSATPVSMKSEKNATGENSRSAPVYLCEPCNIKFSSARTLEAHQTYYCSFRKETGKDGEKNDTDGDSKGESGTILSQGGTGGGKKRERESSGEEREAGVEESGEISGAARGLSGNVSDSIGSNPGKNVKTGKLYSCIYCSYSADKKVSLNRHMRMHSGPPISAIQLSNNSNDEQGPSANSNNSNSSNIGVNKNLPEGVNALERYCQDCDIQFSSIKTYRVHKQYYCSTRHVLKAQQAAATGVASSAVVPGGPQIVKQQGVEIGGGITVTPIRKTSGSPLPPEGSPISTPGPMPPQPFVILPTNPVIIVPYCFIQGASILPGNVLPSQNALVVLPNGSVHGLPATVMPMPMPPPSPSPSQSHGGGISSHFMHNSFSASGNNNSGNNSNGNSSLSPNSQSQSVFNDPKDIIRKICSVPRNQSNSAESTQSESSVGNNGHNHRRNSTSGGAKTPVVQSSFSKENDETMDTDADLDAEADTETYNDGGVCDESMPAIDLTLRNIQPKKERLSADEEKENREVALSRVGIGSHSHILGGGIGNGTPSSLVHMDFHRDRELSSPSERLSVGSGSGSGGKRTPRPSSTSISSSCSTPPALCEPKINGILSRGSPSGRDRDENPSHGGINQQVNSKSAMMMMMMNANANTPALANNKKGSGGVDYSVLEMSKLRGGSGSISSGGKMSPIATQLPGGAILTSATSQSLAELLMSNPPELNESLAKLNPQVLLNSRSAAGSPLGLNLNFNPAMLSALTPELAMRFLEPTYLASLQHSLQQQQTLAQQQQQQQQQQNQQTQQVPPPKRGVSKCIECDIVFYKYENYLVHKEYYCAARTANQKTPTGSIASNLKSPSRESVHGGKESQSQSRMSSCSSPARSEAEVEESLSPLSGPTPVAPHQNKNKSSGSNASTRSQTNSNLQRKSPDSSVEITIPLDSHSSNLSKSKSKSPVAITTPLSISPISSPKDARESKEKTLGTGSPYPCLQCGVKFSTLDNFQTHQAFYCTKRGGMSSCENNNNSCTNQTESKTPSENKTSTNNNNKGFLKCGKCKLAIPEDQMGSHSRVCNGSNGSSCASSLSSGASNSNSAGMAWKCPCCDIYSPTVSAAQKHLESHTGIRAFKCLLCGYRGNTLRGMRTHIRMHFDKRVSDIQEGEYITCITANDPEPNNTAGGSSRGAAITSQVPQAPVLTLPSPDQNHRNVSPNRVELEKDRERVNHSPRSGKGSTASSSAPLSPAELSISNDKLENNNRLHFCHLCNYSSSYKGNVVRHMKLVHKISEESADEIVSAAALASSHANTSSTMSVRSPPEEVNGADSRDSNSNSKCSTDFVSSVSISVSSAKAAASAAVSPQHLHTQNHNESSSQSSSSTELAMSLNSNPPPPPNPSSTTTNNLTNNNNGNSNLTNNNRKTTNAKTKNLGVGANLTVNGIGATGSGGESHSGSENENNETRKCSSRSSSDEDLGTLSTIQKKEKPCAVKYCKSCNIPFNYLSTFNAHKKFYCPGHNLVSSTETEAPERAETPVQ